MAWVAKRGLRVVGPSSDTAKTLTGQTHRRTRASPTGRWPRTTITRAAASPEAQIRAPARGSVFNLDSIGICPLIGADQKRPAGDRNDANSP
jgi:hypothetical protein